MSDKLHNAIERMRMASEISLEHYQKPILLTYSGGKDSDVCIEVAKIAGIPFEVVNSHTTADAPETVRHIRKKFQELELAGIPCRIQYPEYKGNRVSMWTLIPQQGLPPSRIMRYCCAVLKETAGKNRAIVTGVRWAESIRRKNTRGIAETKSKDPAKRIMLLSDDDDGRRFIEKCQQKASTVFNPVIDWKDAEVWDFLRERQVETNPLYRCGFDRIGCVGCPMAGKKVRLFEFARYPAYKTIYIHAFDRMLEARKAAGKETKWESGREVFRWWMEENPDQLLFEGMED